jgi:hypothetical protein
MIPVETRGRQSDVLVDPDSLAGEEREYSLGESFFDDVFRFWLTTTHAWTARRILRQYEAIPRTGNEGEGTWADADQR